MSFCRIRKKLITQRCSTRLVEQIATKISPVAFKIRPWRSPQVGHFRDPNLMLLRAVSRARKKILTRGLLQVIARTARYPSVGRSMELTSRLNFSDYFSEFPWKFLNNEIFFKVAVTYFFFRMAGKFFHLLLVFIVYN